jgi:translation initiation factor 1
MIFADRDRIRLGGGRTDMPRAAKKRIDDDGDISLGSAKGFGVSIGGILGGGGELEKKIAAPPERGKTARDGAGKTPLELLRLASRAILRRESAGRCGRTVTSVELRPVPDKNAAEELAKIMRHSFGCGSHVEGRKIVLQGDMRERAAAWLEKQGVREITS